MKMNRIEIQIREVNLNKRVNFCKYCDKEYQVGKVVKIGNNTRASCCGRKNCLEKAKKEAEERFKQIKGLVRSKNGYPKPIWFKETV